MCLQNTQSSSSFFLRCALNFSCYSFKARLFILSTYSPNVIYFSLPSSFFSSSPKINVIHSSRASLPYLTKRIQRVSSTVTLPLYNLSYIKNVTKLQSFLGSRPVLSEMHLLYMVIYSSRDTKPSRSSSTSQMIKLTSDLKGLQPRYVRTFIKSPGPIFSLSLSSFFLSKIKYC